MVVKAMSKTPQKVYSNFEEKIFRLCASSKDYEKSTNIFSKTGEAKRLQATVAQVLNVAITKNDGLPSNICRHCEGMLTRFTEFKSSVISTQEQLKAMVTTKRCKVFSPSCEPEKKVRVLQKDRSSARSLVFHDNSAQGNACSNSTPESNGVSLAAVRSLDSTPVLVPDGGKSSASASNILSKVGLQNPEVCWLICSCSIDLNFVSLIHSLANFGSPRFASGGK